jgi:serine/threonine-protein phosphatase 2A regulatory subunit A
VPYLAEFTDDDDEILLVLSEQLLQLSSFVGGAEHTHCLLVPLETRTYCQL